MQSNLLSNVCIKKCFFHQKHKEYILDMNYSLIQQDIQKSRKTIDNLNKDVTLKNIKIQK